MASSTGSHTPRAMSDADELSRDELVKSIKQLLINSTRYLREAGSVEAAEDALLHLEEHDSNFHRYDLVKKLRSQIDGQMGGLIDIQLDSSNMLGTDPVAGHETLVSRITDSVLSSGQYHQFKASLKKNMTDACHYLVKNFDAEFVVEGSDKSTVGQMHRKHEFSDGESSLDDSSLNHSTATFINNEDFRKIAEALESKKPLELRKETLRKLTTIAAVDIQNAESWPRIMHALQNALNEQDPTIWECSLRLLAKGLSVNNHNTSKEIYTALVQHLKLQFQSRSRNVIPKLRDGLDTTRDDHIRVLKVFRLINQFQRYVPQCWVRYPDKFVEEVLDTTVGLLGIHPNPAVGSPAIMTPIHFLALLDIKANWFITWMHGHYSRSQLLKILLKNRAIVDNAVRACIEYVMSRKIPLHLLDDTSETASNDSSGVIRRRLQYTMQELEFAYFMHSLSLLGRLLLHKQGRSLFPTRVREREKPVGVIDLLVVLIQLLTTSNNSPRSYTALMQCDPCVMVCDVIKKLARSEQVCQECICRDEVTDVLLAPISQWMDGGNEIGLPSDGTLSQVAEVLSAIASTSCGRQHLLYGQQLASSAKRFTKTKSSPAHILAEFARRALSDNLPPGVGLPSKHVVGNLVFVCRQLYAMCEGLAIVSSYDLHIVLAAAWRVAMVEADKACTPTPSVDGMAPSMNRMSQYIVLWEDALRDNLLNFAATPKGVLLLQQTGAINECVAYLHSRYARKLQVSRCEKFGYGYMLSQVVSCAPGIKALEQTDFIKSLVHSIWGALEIADDFPVYSPKTWPIVNLDKSVRKFFANVVTLLSSFLVANEILGGCILPTKEHYTLRDMPDTIPGLFDRLVMVDTEEKIHALFNYEQSHVFGLRLLSIMTSCLDTLLMLQTQYNFHSMLLKAQADNVATEGGKLIMVDMLSVERNYILVKTYLIGGPTERVLPPHSLDESAGHLLGAGSSQFPLFSTLPVPQEYHAKISIKVSTKQESDLSKILSESKKSQLDLAWLEKCRKAFCSLLTTKPEAARNTVLQDLVERCLHVTSEMPEEAIFPQHQYTASEAVVKHLQLTPSQQLGIDMTIRYGLTIKLVSVTAKEGREKLGYLVKKSTYFLQQQQKAAGGFQCFKGVPPGFDWFVGTVYLLMAGNVDRSWRFLYKFSTLAASAYLWSNRMHASVHLPEQLRVSAIPPVFSSTCHNIELILQAEVSHVYSAFKMSGFSPAQICQHWIRQCFWNYLDWLDICHYICVCMILGVDYQVYICVAILRHMQLDILTHSQNKNLIVFLKEEPIRGFRTGDHLEYMRELENKFRKTVLPDMLNLSKP